MSMLKVGLLSAIGVLLCVPAGAAALQTLPVNIINVVTRDGGQDGEMLPSGSAPATITLCVIHVTSGEPKLKIQVPGSQDIPVEVAVGGCVSYENVTRAYLWGPGKFEGVFAYARDGKPVMTDGKEINRQHH